MRKKEKKFSFRLNAQTLALITFCYVFLLFKHAAMGNSSTEPLIKDNDYHSQLAFELAFSDPDSARKIAQQRLEIIKAEEKTLEKLPFYNVIGISYFFQARYNKALENFYTNLELAIEANEEYYKAHSYNNIGLINLLTGKYKDALEFLLKSAELYEALDDTISHLRSVNNIGRVYFNANDLDKADYYYSKAFQGFTALGFDEGISSVANHKAQYYLKENKPDSALFFFRKAVEFGKKTEYTYGLSVIFLEKGNFYLKTGNPSKAIVNYQISDSLAKILQSPLQTCYPMLGISQAYLKMGKTNLAKKYVNKVSEINKELKNEELSYKINEALSKVFEAKGNVEKAFYYYRLSNEKKARLFDQTEVYQLYNVEIEELGRKMELKELEMEKQELLLGKRKNLIYLIVLASASLIIILSLLYYFYINRVKQIQKENLHQSRIRHTHEKNRAALKAELHERKRLGMELHDGVGPLISLTKLNVTNVLEDETLSPERKTELLGKSADNLDEVLREMKYISYNLAPLVLIEKGFEYALRDLVAKIRNLKKHKISININGLDNSLDGYFEHALYRAIQETFNNIILHAEASEINVEILQSKTDLTIMIEDNGKGFDAREDGPGLGLKSTVSRIEGLGGRLLIDSKPGRGTIITIIIPLSENAFQIKKSKLSLPKDKPNKTEQTRHQYTRAGF